MKCIYFTKVVFKGKRCGKKAFGLLGGNSYCAKHLDVKQKSEKPQEKPRQVSYPAPIKSFGDQFREMHGRSPNKWEIIASI